MQVRIATYNVESLDAGPDADPPLSKRVAVLRPMLQRLRADILCLQEVNAQQDGGGRGFRALDLVVQATAYAGFHRAATLGRSGRPADVHNLVTLSRWPIEETRQYQNDLVHPPAYIPVTASPRPGKPVAVEWDRPLLYTRIGHPAGPLHVLNLHLHAPLAAPVAGQKHAPFVWKSAQGWAEGFYIAAMKRTGQALEARLVVDRIFDGDPDALIAVAGDLNAEARETPLRALCADEENTGNPVLAGRALTLVESAIASDERFTVLHRGHRLMLDHLLVSPALRRCHRRSAVFNEDLPDEYVAYVGGQKPAQSFHAPLVADFDLPED